MSRVKTVFTNDEIVHHWVHQNAPAGHSRNKQKNLFMNGPSLRSYYTEIARIVNHPNMSRENRLITVKRHSRDHHTGTIEHFDAWVQRIALVSDKRYSNTTSEHIGIARWKIQDDNNTFVIPVEGAAVGYSILTPPFKDGHISNPDRKKIVSYLEQKYHETLDKASRARENKAGHMMNALDTLDELNVFTTVFPLSGVRKDKRYDAKHKMPMKTDHLYSDNDIGTSEVKKLLEDFQKPRGQQKWMSTEDTLKAVKTAGLAEVLRAIDCGHARYVNGKPQFSVCFHELSTKYPRELNGIMQLAREMKS